MEPMIIIRLITGISVICIIFAVSDNDVDNRNDRSISTVNIQADNVFTKGRLFYRTLLLDSSSKSIYVGGMNNLYKLWMYNINDTDNDAFFSEVVIPPTSEALEKCSYRSRNKDYQCQNHIRVLLKRSDGSLYVCSTNAYNPLVRTLDSAKLASENGGISGAAICPVDPDDNGTAVWVANGNPLDIPSIYTGTVTDFTQTNRIIYRPPLMDMKSGEVAQSFMRTVHTDSKWLNEPNFVGSFDFGDSYVYFFFREIAVEYINCGKAVYSRVARICKVMRSLLKMNDVGGENVLKQNWATFTKIRLNCSISGEFPFYFDEIQDVVKVVSDKGDVNFYATFTTNLHGFYGSAVCVFNLKSINEIFDRGSFKEQTSSSHAWLPVLPNLVPTPRPGQCVENTKVMSDTVLHFIKSHPLMDSSVSSYCNPNSDRVEPVYYKKDVVFTKLAVDNVDINGKQMFILFVATVSGELYKILRWLDDSGAHHSSLLTVYKLQDDEPVRAMRILSNEYIYVAQDNQVSQLEIGQCFRYKLCFGCVSDPYCSWSTVRQQCDRWQDTYDQTTGWIRMSAANPSSPSCIQQTRQMNKVAYPGDAVHFDCYIATTAKRLEFVSWYKNNKILDSQGGNRHLFTVDGGLVLVNVSVEDAGHYHCVEQSHVTVRYQLTMKDVKCQTPQNVNSYQTVYKEWCKEFQEYKRKINDWQKRQEENMKCLKTNTNGKKLALNTKNSDDKIIYNGKKSNFMNAR